VAGNPVEYTLVHFKNRAVGVVPYDNGHVYLVGQYRYAIKAYSWELPEGGCPPGSKTLDAAKWELEEETGLRAEHYEPFIEMHTSNAITDEWATVYLATGLSQGAAKPEESEVLQTRKVSLDAFLELVENGEITDAMTVAAAYKLSLLKSQGRLPNAENVAE
jgi:8-oxo-dGTP pyrophosphatase MutT (NUDIX family)